MGDIIAQTRFENVSKLSNDPLLVRGNTLRSGEDSLKLKELMELCTNLQTRVLDLEKTKTTQAEEIGRRIHDIDVDEDITLVNNDNEIFDVDALAGEEVFIAEQSGNVVKEVVVVINVASTIPVSGATITDVEITLAQALAELKSAKPKADNVTNKEENILQLKEQKGRGTNHQLKLNKEKSCVLGHKRLHGFLEVTTAQVMRTTSGIRAYAFENFDLEDMTFEMISLPIRRYIVCSVKIVNLQIVVLLQSFRILKLKNGDSWVSEPTDNKEKWYNQLQRCPPNNLSTAKKKTNKKNDVKARGLLLMALPNEHQLTFSQYLDAKSIYENFSGNKCRVSDSILIGLQKIDRSDRHALLGDDHCPKKNLNSNLISRLPPVWNTHVKKSVVQVWCTKLAFMTAPSTSSTNDANTTSPQVSTASPNINAASLQVCTASVSDNTVHLIGVTLAERTISDKHGSNGHFQTSDYTLVENFCSKTCLKNYETLKKQCDDLIVKLNQAEFTEATYKRGLATVEAHLITYRNNEVLFSEEVAVLKREVACKEYEINVLKSEFEKVKQEKDGIDFKIEKFDKASKVLDQQAQQHEEQKDLVGSGCSRIEPTSIAKALSDSSWVEAMQEELLQFKLQ
ncbi:hypothetical protein Tco_0711728 [Tanacetum coccineum]